jgi:Mce-associated membrane protein
MTNDGFQEDDLRDDELRDGDLRDGDLRDDEPDALIDEAAAIESRSGRRRAPTRLLLPALAVASAAGAGFLGWQYASERDMLTAAKDSVAAARDTTVAILSYRADTAEQDLTGARDRLTGEFLDSYTTLINDKVIPGAREKKVSAVAEVPAAASVSATARHAVALVFVNQTISAGGEPPTGSNWSVRVTLDKVDGRWLVAGFDPV